MSKLLPPMFMQLTLIFSLQFTNCSCFSPYLLFPCHTRLVGSLYVFSMRKILFTERSRITLVFAIHTIAPLTSESLLGNTLVNGSSPKVSRYLPLFLYVFGFGICCFSRKYEYYIFMSPPIPKMNADAFYLISSA